MDEQTLSRGPAGQHPTCIEVTGPGDIARGERTWICGQDCPRPAGPDPARDRRRDLYADRERRRAARALDRFLEAFNEFGTAGSTGARVAGERFVEQLGDYVLARLGRDETSLLGEVEALLGPSAARDVADQMHDEAYGLHQKAHYGVAPGSWVNDETGVPGAYRPAGQLDPDGLVPDARDLPDDACLRLTERAEYCPAAGSPRCASCTWRPAAGE